MPTLTTLIQSRLAQPRPAPRQRTAVVRDAASREAREASTLLHEEARRAGPRHPWSQTQGMGPLASVMAARRSSRRSASARARARCPRERRRQSRAMHPRLRAVVPCSRRSGAELRHRFFAELRAVSGHTTSFDLPSHRVCSPLPRCSPVAPPLIPPLIPPVLPPLIPPLIPPGTGPRADFLERPRRRRRSMLDEIYATSLAGVSRRVREIRRTK